MLELATWLRPLAHGIAASLHGLPGYAAAALIALPVVLALFARSWAAAAAAILFALAAVIFLAAGPELTLSVIGGSLAFAAALAAALAGFSERDRRARQAEIESRLDHVHRQMTVFLEALDRRQAELDRIREEARRQAENQRRIAAAGAAAAAAAGAAQPAQAPQPQP